MYQGDVLKEAVLDGKPLELFDICDTDGNPTGETTERSVAHTLGTVHRTVHTWVVRQSADDGFEVLLQKRSLRKDSFRAAMRHHPQVIFRQGMSRCPLRYGSCQKSLVLRHRKRI